MCRSPESRAPRRRLAPVVPLLIPFLALLVACHGPRSAGEARPGASRRPNVVLVMVDDLGYGDLGCTGHPSIRTPALDRLAADGVRLTDFHSGATVCTPSRMALLTGCYPARVGWTQGVLGYGMELDEGLSPAAPTMAERFRDAGYVTALSGKWHLGNRPDMRPHRRGFNSAFYVALSNNQTKRLWRGDEVVQEPFDNRLLSEQFTDEAVRFIARQGDAPFFLYLPYTAPHFPVEPHPEWRGRSAFGDYGDVVEELDARVGEVLDALAARDLTRHTLVVFCSDNGPNPGEAASSLPFRGEKWSALEGGTRVPAIAAWPGVIPAGGVRDELVSAMDLLPTLLRSCGVEAPDGLDLDGLDVWDTFVGNGGPHPRDELLYWHGMDPEPQAIRVGDWKLFFDGRHALRGSGTARRTAAQDARLAPLLAGLRPDVANPPLLFDLREDPGETVDRSTEFPERVAALEQRARELLARIRARRIPPDARADAE